MFPEPSSKFVELRERLAAFMDEHIYPHEKTYQEQIAAGDRWKVPAILDELKAKAKAAVLWNLFLPDTEHGARLTNLEYAPLCEMMGRSVLAPEVFNCSAPAPGTWKCWPDMERLNRKNAGSYRCWLVRFAAASP